MNDIDCGAIIRLFGEVQKKYRGTGITRWAVYRGQGFAIGRRVVTDRQTGEHYVQSAALDLQTKSFVGGSLQPDGSFEPRFKVGDPAMDSRSRMEDAAVDALEKAEEHQTPEKGMDDLTWAAAFGTVAAKLGSATGAEAASKAYRALGKEELAQTYAALAETL